MRQTFSSASTSPFKRLRLNSLSCVSVVFCSAGVCRGNAAVLLIIYKDCFMSICICRQCAINSIRSGVCARRRRMYTPYVCDTFDRSVRSKLRLSAGVDGHGRTVIVAVAVRAGLRILAALCEPIYEGPPC